MYQALYRKWRPKTFDDVVGQQHVTETLKRQVMLNRLSHAYLFTGTRGTGKTTCAKLLARAVNCEDPQNGNPCGKCPACLGIENGSILDVLEIDAASNNSVDNVRALREDAVYTPASVKKRVYIIDEVHMLSGSAFNALLKILEEPPEHLMFILATTELHKVPATILSRCQRYSFKRVSPEDIQSRLKMIAGAEGMELTEEAAEMLSRMADGALRDALSLLDQCSGEKVDKERVINAIGVADSDEIYKIFTAVKSRDGSAVMSALDELYMNGRDVSAVLDRLSELYRDLLMLRLAPKGGAALLKGGFTAAELKDLAQNVSVPALLGGLDVLEETISGLRASANRRIAAELCLLRLCDYAPAAPVTSFINAEPSREAPVQDAPLFSAAEKKPEQAPAVTEEDDEALPWEESPAIAPVESAETAPKAEPEPQAVSAPISQNTADNAPAAGGELDWQGILKALRRNMEDYILNILADDTQVEANIDGNVIRIMAKNPFALNMLDSAEIKKAVQTAAAGISPGTRRVEITEFKESEKTGESKLDRLMSRFDIKFNDEGE